MLIVTIYDVDQDGDTVDRFKVFYKDGPDGEAVDVTDEYVVAACELEGAGGQGFAVIKK